MNISRRRLGSLLAASTALAGLSACSFAKNGSVVSGTLNVTQVNDWFQAGINMANLALALPGVSVALGAAGVAAVKATEAALTAAMKTFSDAAGSSVTVSLDTSSIKTDFTSGLTQLQSLLTQFREMMAALNVSSTVYAQINLWVSSLAAIVSIATGMLSMSATGNYAADQPMTEAQALANLGVH
jgi:hypothetical protein